MPVLLQAVLQSRSPARSGHMAHHGWCLRNEDPPATGKESRPAREAQRQGRPQCCRRRTGPERLSAGADSGQQTTDRHVASRESAWAGIHPFGAARGLPAGNGTTSPVTLQPGPLLGDQRGAPAPAPIQPAAVHRPDAPPAAPAGTERDTSIGAGWHAACQRDPAPNVLSGATVEITPHGRDTDHRRLHALAENQFQSLSVIWGRA